MVYGFQPQQELRYEEKCKSALITFHSAQLFGWVKRRRLPGGAFFFTLLSHVKWKCNIISGKNHKNGNQSAL